MLDGHRRRGSGAQGGQQVATYHGADHASVWIKQENRGLMVDVAMFFEIIRPVATRLKAKRHACFVEPAFEAIERVFVADCLATDGEFIGVF